MSLLLFSHSVPGCITHHLFIHMSRNGNMERENSDSDFGLAEEAELRILCGRRQYKLCFSCFSKTWVFSFCCSFQCLLHTEVLHSLPKWMSWQRVEYHIFPLLTMFRWKWNWNNSTFDWKLFHLELGRSGIPSMSLVAEQIPVCVVFIVFCFVLCISTDSLSAAFVVSRQKSENSTECVEFVTLKSL